ncbi:hypothetical protein BHE74_00016031 [Ensete ventricosum]|nr:hypothetical protein BHE74_00016031 [Ensete ventricosum]
MAGNSDPPYVCYTEWYRPYRAVRTGPPVDRYVDRPLADSTFDWGCFRLVITRNRSVAIDFDRRRPLKGGINLAAAREKEDEEEEEGEPRDLTPLSLDDPVPSSPSHVGHRRR